MALRTLSLSGERPDLALHLGDQVIEPLQIERRLLQPAFGGATPIAIQPDPSRLPEQLAAVVGPIREQRVDHLAFDDDTGVGTQAGAAQQVRDVAQPTGSAIQEVVTLTGARQPAREDHFLKSDRKGAVLVLEMERDFGDVTARRADEP